ncbi:hypothetical protein [Umezawaea sp. NPDC059074]|uniref:hypothetical protein n=1 Tax=Umezawaea sp. NPDC059074 TaxID=3346716 RepID=UPI00369431A2
MDRELARRLRWFDDGAPRLRLVLDKLQLSDRLPADRDYYACPCCLVAFPREAVAARVLTDEHVPADGVGGRRLLLTCDTCNNSSGTSFDSHAVRRSHVDDFVLGVANGRTHKVTSYIDGIPLRGTIERTKGGGLQIFGIPKQNDKKVMEAYFKKLHSYAQDDHPKPDHSFVVHSRYDERRARISWIRSAYLAAFAGLGWKYIFRPVMKPVRDQLKQPNDEILPTYMARDINALSSGRRIMIVSHPPELRSVAITMGQYTVFLPAPFDSTTFEVLNKEICRRRDGGDALNVNIRGKTVPWPKFPTYFLDPPY